MNLPRLTAWTFTITHTHNGCHWTVHRNGATHAQGDAPDYDTAWLDSHDAIPDETATVAHTHGTRFHH